MIDRLIELESKFSHQDLAIDELQKLVFEQHRRIETLEKMVSSLTQTLKENFAATTGAPPQHEKPPHY